MLFCLFRERACAGKYPHSQKEIINELLPLLTYIHTIKTYVHKYMYLFTYIVAKTSFYLHENCRMQRQRQKIPQYLRWVPKGKRPHEVLRKVSQPFSEKNRWVKILKYVCTVKLGDKERFDKEQIGVKEPFPVTNCQFTS